MSSSPEEGRAWVARAEWLAEREEQRVPSIARRFDLDKVLHSPAMLRAALSVTALRRAYRRLRRAVGLPT